LPFLTSPPWCRPVFNHRPTRYYSPIQYVDQMFAPE